MSNISHIIKRDERVVPFTKIRITNAIYRAAVAVGGRDRDEADQMADKVIKHLEAQTGKHIHPTVEEIQDAVEKVLIETGKAMTAKAFILYRADRAQRRAARIEKKRDLQKKDPIPWKKIHGILSWAIDHNVHTVDSLNSRLRAGEFGMLVRESEDEYNLDISRAADSILKRKDEIKVVIVAGPSSSGKTTTTIKTSEILSEEGFSFVPFHVDNYFHNLEDHPQDEYGDYDYETPQALNLEMINDHLSLLLKGETVQVPLFDFKAGKRIDNHHDMSLKKGEILLIDSHHGLHRELTGSIPNDSKFRLYIETLLEMKNADGGNIRWTDVRILRRMTRDKDHRNVDPRQTLEHWHYVRSSEMDHIIPYANKVDYIVNGALPYELPVMKRRWNDIFGKWVEEYTDNPDRIDAFTRVTRIHNLFSSLADITDSDEQNIPGTSLIREFIGGSVYKY